MRKSSLALLAAVIGLAASQASAADLPRKAPAYVPPAPPPLTWTGCYIGANAGGAWGRVTLEGPFGGTADRSTNNASFVGGGQIGCDYQFAGGWVIGFRNMFDGTTNSRDRAFNSRNPSWPNRNWNVRNLNSMVRCPDGPDRLFVATQLAALLSGRRGLGSCRGRLSCDHWRRRTVTGGSASTTKTGWTIGGGWEYRFSPQWSLFIEGNYYDFGSRDRTIVTPVATACAAGCVFSAKATAATALIGVNYRFGGFGAGL